MSLKESKKIVIKIGSSLLVDNKKENKKKMVIKFRQRYSKFKNEK